MLEARSKFDASWSDRVVESSLTAKIRSGLPLGQDLSMDVGLGETELILSAFRNPFPSTNYSDRHAQCPRRERFASRP